MPKQREQARKERGSPNRGRRKFVRDRIPILQFAVREEETGDVTSHRGVVDREAIERLMAKSRTNPRTKCRLWTASSFDEDGYGAIVYKGKRWRAHRLSYIAHYGRIPQGLFVCHACDNPACIAIHHLFLGTPKENTLDMRRKGRGRGALGPAMAAKIKRRLLEGAGATAIARETGISHDTVYAIKRGRSWAYVTPASSKELKYGPLLGKRPKVRW